ncbi:MAG: hypothetical protein ABH828_00435 [archaeon]
MKKILTVIVFILMLGLIQSVSAAMCPEGTTATQIESFDVQADGTVATTTAYLASGTTYLVEASGTANAGDTIDFDAQYSLTNRIVNDIWTDLVSGYEGYGPDLLELKVNGNFVDWGAYNAMHKYMIELAGDGNQASFEIYDTYPVNNVGYLTVNIYECADVKVNGGGHILEEMGKKNNWNDVSFGGYIAEGAVSGLFGEWQINFHNVGDDAFDKGKFHTTDITTLNLFAGNSNTCTEAMNFYADGTFNGMPGYSIIFRAGDSSEPSSYSTDTVRVSLYGPGGLVYDTHAGDFTDESSCVGTARTSLDNGNIVITG